MFVLRSYNRTMASWRCPFCGTPQPETARCWVCHRSTTTCATCRHFRKAVTLKLGYCALDRLHSPLTGEEQRACWERPTAEAGTLDIDGSGASGRPAVPFGLWASPESTIEAGRSSSRN